MTITKNAKSVFMLAAHPDDEVLGCGGAIARHTDAGDQVNIMFLADGVTARDDVYDPQGRDADISAREDMARMAADILGAQPPQFLRLPDNQLDRSSLLEITKAVENALTSVRPDIVYTHHASDLNVDHRIAHQVILTACRPTPDQSVRAIYTWETLSSTEWAFAETGDQFRPSRFVDISSQLERKMKALACYASEMHAFPHGRSEQAVEALARHRGAIAGLDAAEAFQVVRETW